MPSRASNFAIKAKLGGSQFSVLLHSNTKLGIVKNLSIQCPAKYLRVHMNLNWKYTMQEEHHGQLLLLNYWKALHVIVYLWQNPNPADIINVRFISYK